MAKDASFTNMVLLVAEHAHKLSRTELN